MSSSSVGIGEQLKLLRQMRTEQNKPIIKQTSIPSSLSLQSLHQSDSLQTDREEPKDSNHKFKQLYSHFETLLKM